MTDEKIDKLVDFYRADRIKYIQTEKDKAKPKEPKATKPKKTAGGTKVSLADLPDDDLDFGRPKQEVEVSVKISSGGSLKISVDDM